MLKKIQDKIYTKLVIDNPEVRNLYENYKLNFQEFHKKHRLISWMYMIVLNYFYKPENNIKITFNENNKNNNKHSKLTIKEEDLIFPESLYRKKGTPVQFTRNLKDYDIISFDIFDTLIFRPFEEPADLFNLVGLKCNIPGFRKYREEAEKKARIKSISNETTIFKIYDELEKIIYIDKEKVMQVELELEFELCFANPYMLEVFNILKYNKKKIIAISNMYLPKDILEKLLVKCGYEGFEDIYISCDYERSKGNKKLYHYVKESYVGNQTIIHIGDNYQVDVVNARSCGIDSRHYPNCSAIAKKYRPNFPFSISSSLYKGIVATQLHNGIKEEKTTPAYEYGFICGGIMIAGFIEYLDKFCERKDIDYIMFVARDGLIVKNIYEKHSSKKIDSAYVLWSRTMATFLNLKEGIKEIFDRMIYPLMHLNKDITIMEVLENTNCTFLEEKLINYNLSMNEVLSEANIENIKLMYKENEKQIIQLNEDNLNAAKKYFNKFIHDKNNIMIVDVGWTGKSIINLENFLKKQCDFKGNIYGVMAGAFDNEFTNDYLLSEKLNSYMFSKYKNKELLERFKMNQYNEVILIESLFSAPSPSALLVGKGNDEGYKFKFGTYLVENNQIIKEIHEGIKDFCDIYYTTIEEYREYINITEENALTPIQYFGQYREWLNKVFDNYYFSKATGIDKIEKVDKLIDILNRE